MNFHHKNNGNFNFKHHIHKNDSNMYTKKLITGNWSKLRHKLEDEHSVQSGTGPW